MKSQHKHIQVYEAVVETPFGAVGIVSQGMQVVIDLLPEKLEQKPTTQKLAQNIAAQIEAYLKNANSGFNLPIKLKGTPFQRNVWQIIDAIPSGQVLTYSQIAEQLKSSPRAVANACGANFLPIVIPCHRVVAKDSLGGFMRDAEHGLTIKKWLLKHEGAIDENGKLV